MRYRVEHEDGWGFEVDAHSPGYAAELAVERFNVESVSYPNEREVTVTEEDGNKTRWTVELRMEPVYTAREAR